MNNYIPSTVYHYCSVETFCKIITNKELWLTDITKSNDSKELHIAYEKLKDEFDKRIKKCNKNSDDKIPLIKCRELLDSFDINDMLFHICCFSTKRDSLSQWTMYADNATGVAIGFKADELSNLKNSKDNYKNIDFGKINYSLSKFTDDVNKHINEILNKYNQDKENYANWIFSFLDYIINDIMKKVYFYKHPSFKQESEYRLVYNSKPYVYTEESDNSKTIIRTFKNEIETLTPHAKLGEISVYSSKGKLISYRPLCIKNLQTFYNIINEIVIGPKSSVSSNDVRILFNANGLDIPMNKIKRSNITYQ